MQDIIGKALLTEQDRLIGIASQHLSPDDTATLDRLLNNPQGLYQITRLKREPKEVVQLRMQVDTLRTQQGLAAARARGTKLGRPKGSRDKEQIRDPFRGQIKEYLELKIPLRRIQRIINPQLKNPITYNSYQCFVRQDRELLELWQAQT